MALEQRPIYTHTCATPPPHTHTHSRQTPSAFLLCLGSLKNLLFLWHPLFRPFSFPLFLFSIFVPPHILCVCLSPEGSHATRLINNYRVHKIGREEKKKQFLCRLMSDMRETKITKRQSTIKRSESLHIPFSILCSCSLLFFFTACFSFSCFYLLCLSLLLFFIHCSIFISPQSCWFDYGKWLITLQKCKLCGCVCACNDYSYTRLSVSVGAPVIFFDIPQSVASQERTIKCK